MFRGQRIRESTKLKNKELARILETARRNALAMGAGGVQAMPAPMFFREACDVYLLDREAHWSPKTRVIHHNSYEHLKPHFAKLLLQELKPKHISTYQRLRLQEGASPRSVNIEISLVRLVMRKHKMWLAVAEEVHMLKERRDVGRAISEDERHRILIAAKASSSRSLYPAILLSMHTGLRHSELRLLRWRQIDLVERILQVGKSKTAVGEGRIIPLSETATQCLLEWRSKFPDAQPQHAVFPRESYALIGKKGTFGGTVAPYQTFPDQPTGSWKTAWQRAKSIAKVECRWHDLRHSWASMISESQASDATIQALAGWMSPKMLERYSHIRNEAKRHAIASLDGFTKGYDQVKGTHKIHHSGGEEDRVKDVSD
jgi:integrase